MKKQITKIITILLIVFTFASCTENRSNGERVGTITAFSKTGIIWKSYEGHLNVTQTGMNSSNGFDFSIDNDNEPVGMVATLDSAANNGWKVKIIFHQVSGFNWLRNRGHTNYFISSIIVLDKNFDNPFGIKKNDNNSNNINTGHVIDTIYIVITPTDANYYKFFKHTQDTTSK
jgi:hypothetical protein